MKPIIRMLLAAIALIGCEKQQPDVPWQGYVEVELTYVGLPESGEIVDVSVKRGDGVAQGQILYRLENEDQTRAIEEAEAMVAEAQAELADLGKGERPEELDIIQAQLDEAMASLELSEPRLARRKKMVTNNIVGEEDLDAAQSAVLSDRGRIEQYTARLDAAKLPGRADRIEAAKARVAQALANLERAKWRLSRRVAIARVAGRVENTLYRVGEYAKAGEPVVALRAAHDVKIRFFVPEPQLSALAPGGKVSLSCDGCKPGQSGTVTFIANEAEFTPPVIYSIGRRDKLVFMVEALPDDRTMFWPAGLPIDVRPFAVENTP